MRSFPYNQNTNNMLFSRCSMKLHIHSFSQFLRHKPSASSPPKPPPPHNGIYQASKIHTLPSPSLFLPLPWPFSPSSYCTFPTHFPRLTSLSPSKLSDPPHPHKPPLSSNALNPHPPSQKTSPMILFPRPRPPHPTHLQNLTRPKRNLQLTRTERL